jgi:stage II sporulation protein D
MGESEGGRAPAYEWGGLHPIRFGAAIAAIFGVAGASDASAGAHSTGAPVIRVLLIESEDEVVLQASPPRGSKVRIRAVSGGLRVDHRPGGKVWRLPGSGVKAVGSLRVRGDVEVRRVQAGLQVVNRVTLEDYVAGILGREIYPGWDPETLKAQAVVARTYALHQRDRSLHRPFDVRAGTRSQVYGGVDAETPALRAAVTATAGEVLIFEREPILAAYHSASGGQTASAEEVWGESVPYLVRVEVAGEEVSPDTYWRASISASKLGRALAGLDVDVGTPREVQVASRSPSGRALRVAIRGEGGSHTMDARALRGALGGSVIRSTLFEIRAAPNGFVFVGSGHGHGVGMSQWGAQAMAERGVRYREILAAFYPGATLETGFFR